MGRLDQYEFVGKRRLRNGYTTGACAAAATRAAVELLLGSNRMEIVYLDTPAGIVLELEVLDLIIIQDVVSCAICKDSGDDPDVTNGIKVYVHVKKIKQKEFHITGGLGVGRVTQAGLGCAVGGPAINSVPRQMIRKEVEEVTRRIGYQQGLEISISIPNGDELAKKTFNPRLGIEGGLSILGTSGLVRPMSEKAMIDTIEVELNMLKAANVEDLLISPGNYGEAFAEKNLNLEISRLIKSSNYLGETIDLVVGLGFKSLLLIGHLGKLIKVAAGIMNTHSRYADGRGEIMACHAALCGVSQKLVKQLYTSVSTDAAIERLDQENLRDVVLASIIEKIGEHLRHRSGKEFLIEAVIFSNKYGFLGETAGAALLIDRHLGINSIGEKE